MTARDSAAFRFGNFLLQPAARELHHGDERVALAPKVLEALLWLFENRQRAVGRDELGAAVWGKADVTDTQLDQLVRNLRRAVGDNGSSQDVIRTVPRFGYRWVAEVERLPATPEPGMADPPAPSAPDSASTAVALPTAVSARWFPLRPLRLAFVAVIVAAGIGFWMSHTTQQPAITTATTTQAPRATPLVAVLPVGMDAIDGSEWAWLRLGLMDLLAARLREGHVAVVPSHNIVALLGPQDRLSPSAAKVREATGAGIVIAPSVVRSGDRWRLQLDLAGMEGRARELEIHGADPVGSVREAADRVLVMLGQPPVSGRSGEERSDEEALVQRMDAGIDGNRFDIARQLLDEAPEALREAPRVRLREAEILLGENRPVQALAEFQALADAPADQSIDAETRVGALQGAAVVLGNSGRFDEAARRFDATVALAQQSRLPMLYGDAMQSRGVMRAMQGQFDTAESDFAQARIALEMIGDTLGLAQLDATEAGTLISRQRYAEADVLQARAIERLERFPPGEFLQAAYGNKIHMDLAMLDAPGAFATAGKALAMIDQARPPMPLDPSLALSVTRAQMTAGRLDEAGRGLHVLLARLDPVKSPELYSSALLQQAELALGDGHPAEAARLAETAEGLRALPALAVAHYARGHASASLLRVRALQAQGQTKKSQAVITRFEQWAARSDDPAVAMRLALARAEQSALEDSAAAAKARFDLALDVASRSAPADLARVATAYGRHLMAAGQLDQATRVVGRVARWSGQDFDCALLQVQLYHALGQFDAWRRALASARGLAGERAIPSALSVPPMDAAEQVRRARNGQPALTQAPTPST